MKKLPLALIFSFLVLNITSVIFLFFPPAKKWVQSHIFSSSQEILSIVQGDLLHNGSYIKVVKLKTLQGVVLEFYSEPINGSRYLISQVKIPNAKDGFFNHRGEAVQLAVVDLDGDGKMELLAPTFNDQMLARLNPYHYDSNQESFIPFFFSNPRK